MKPFCFDMRVFTTNKIQRLGPSAALSLAVLTLGIVSAAGSIRANPYESIVERNAFGLKDPPPPPSENPNSKPPEPEPPTKITFTGISRAFGTTRAHIMVPVEGKNNEFKYYSLEEKDVQDGIEVLAINPEKESVQIRSQGKALTLTFETHGNQAAGSSAPRPTTTASLSRIRSSSPSASRRTVPNSSSTSTSSSTSASNMREQLAQRYGLNPTQLNSRSGSNPSNSNSRDRLISIPPRQTRSANDSRSQVPQLNPEEQALLIETTREMNQEKIQTGAFPPLPPTMFSPGTPDEEGP